MLKLVSLSLAMISMIGCAHFRSSSRDLLSTSVCDLPRVGWSPWKSKSPRRIRAEAQGGGLHAGIWLKDSACETVAGLLVPASLSYDQVVLKLRRETAPRFDRETRELLAPRVEVEVVGSLKRIKTHPHIWGIVLHEPPVLWPDSPASAK